MESLTKRDYITLQTTALFRNLSQSETGALAAALGLTVRDWPAGAYILQQGEENDSVLIVLGGRLCGERLTRDGRAVTVNEMERGDLFGDVLSGAREKSPVAVRCVRAARTASFPMEALLRATPGLESARTTALRGFINEIGAKYFALNRRVRLLLASGLREKIVLYLLEMDKGGRPVIIPHNREEQARWLGCDRSALSRELSRMQAQGLLRYEREKFWFDAQTLRELCT